MQDDFKQEFNNDFNSDQLEMQFNSFNNFYDEIDIKNFDYENGYFYFPCPCGDRFEISLDELKDGEEIARCPSCSLIVKIVYEEEDLLKY